MPCFLHVHLAVLHPDLQLHLITSKSFDGAGGRSVFTGTKRRPGSTP